MIEVLTPPNANAAHRAALLAARTVAARAVPAATKISGRPLPPPVRRTPIMEPRERPGSTARRRGLSIKGTPVVLVVVSVLLALAGCGQVRHHNGSAQAALTDSAKAAFTVAADRICAQHLETVLAWLGRPLSGAGWQQRATQDEGIYRIIGTTIQRLETLGPPPGPAAGAFAGYVETLNARAALYRLTSMAELRRDRPFAVRLQRRISLIDGIGDRDAHRYGLRICGASPGDLAKAPGEDRPVED
jgi:hypothetical protein